MPPSGIWHMPDSLETTCGSNSKCSMIYLILALDLSFFILLCFWAGTLWFLFFLVISAICFLIFYIHSRIEHSRLSLTGRMTYNFNVDTGLDTGDIATLPSFDYKRENDNYSGYGDIDTNQWAQCVICLGIFQIGEMVRQIPACKHFFHVECIDKWLRLHSTCPMCRSAVVSSPQILPPV